MKIIIPPQRIVVVDVLVTQRDRNTRAQPVRLCPAPAIDEAFGKLS
jgi:hypothetical protein